MDCSELIELYNKVGGILRCDYNKKTVNVLNTNMKCDIKPKDYPDLQGLQFAYSCGYEVNHLKCDLKNPADKLIKKKNYYLNNDEYGFEIKYLNN